jgi:2-dehydro-3-deoxy-D-gluconate 5-dehydrogenase
LTDYPDIKQAFSLKGQRALVTGGASGIGRSIAIALAQMGADVAITVHHQPGTETLRQIEKTGRKARAISLDLADLNASGARSLLREFEKNMGGMDILINNAGIIRRDPFEQHAEADWRDVMATDLDAVWYLSQAAGRAMQARKSGRIIMIASLLSFQGGIRVPAYTAAKHAVVGLAKALSNELAPSAVCVNAIAPGYIATDNTLPLRDDPERNRQILDRIPAARWGNPSDIAGAAVFLASPAASYIQGQTLLVDGGWMAR